MRTRRSSVDTLPIIVPAWSRCDGEGRTTRRVWWRRESRPSISVLVLTDWRGEEPALGQLLAELTPLTNPPRCPVIAMMARTIRVSARYRRPGEMADRPS